MTPDQRRDYFQARLRVRNGRMQDHKPLVEQEEAVGHAVRAGYLYAAMADIVRFMDDPGYERALDHLWTDVVSRKMYLTGGIGTGQHDDEGFGDAYSLPNQSAYCESCAAIAHVLWQHRMNLLKGEARYADVMELALYNGLLSGISISGDHFFYENPLASSGGSRRNSWIGLSCCPTNLTRIIPQVSGLAYAQGRGKVYVNLYMAGQASVQVNEETRLKLVQETDYPWNGHVRLTIAPERPADFALYLRIPCWALGRPVPGDLYRFADAKVPPVGLKINGQAAEVSLQADGYVHLQRRWQAGDIVELELPMPVRRVYAHEKVVDDQGHVALMRGPLVYCLEAADNRDVDLLRVTLPREAVLRVEHRTELGLGGVTIVQAEVPAHGKPPVTLTAVPYYAWANREPGAMTVWIKER